MFTRQSFRFPSCRSTTFLARSTLPRHSAQRFLHHPTGSAAIPDFAFVFDIDGVLVRGSKSLPQAKSALSFLRSQRIPFILLTNGGGYHEEKRAVFLSEEIGIELDPSMIVQSHTPFADMDKYKDGCTLVVGGEYDNCKAVARKYGYKNPITPSDIYAQHPQIWPFSRVLSSYHHERSTSNISKPPHRNDNGDSLKIDSIFVYNDPRDWGLDLSLIVDCLLSEKGHLGTLSKKNNDQSLTNKGYQQDGQPPLFFSNPDLWFAADYSLPRLGQGGFTAALEGIWSAITGGPSAGVELQKTIIGKPHQETYSFAERSLYTHRKSLFPAHSDLPPLEHVYMVGDNPESDIRGANSFDSPMGCPWSSILLRTGVYAGGEPAWKPTTIQDDVLHAVQWGAKNSAWTVQD